MIMVKQMKIQQQPPYLNQSPDLECEGTISLNNVKSGSTVNGSFTVRNNGGQGTKLDWEVDSYPRLGYLDFYTI